VSVNSINAQTLHAAEEFVEQVNRDAEVHTVTLTLNGGHGGVDVKVEGLDDDMLDVTNTFRVTAGRF
jgi:enoyl-CoA hydratase/carnithine racemase